MAPFHETKPIKSLVSEIISGHWTRITTVWSAKRNTTAPARCRTPSVRMPVVLDPVRVRELLERAERVIPGAVRLEVLERVEPEPEAPVLEPAELVLDRERLAAEPDLVRAVHRRRHVK
jgi:hypothetical protein